MSRREVFWGEQGEGERQEEEGKEWSSSPKNRDRKPLLYELPHLTQIFPGDLTKSLRARVLALAFTRRGGQGLDGSKRGGVVGAEGSLLVESSGRVGRSALLKEQSWVRGISLLTPQKAELVLWGGVVMVGSQKVRIGPVESPRGKRGQHVGRPASFDCLLSSVYSLSPAARRQDLDAPTPIQTMYHTQLQIFTSSSSDRQPLQIRLDISRQPSHHQIHVRRSHIPNHHARSSPNVPVQGSHLV